MTRARTLLGGVLIALPSPPWRATCSRHRSAVACGQDEQIPRFRRTGTVVYVSGDAGGRVRQVVRRVRRVADGPVCRRAAVAASTLICLWERAG
ncbi:MULTISPECIES: hypothetical protein [unclassified Streptomyces]|uniref:hypothetical protein n=1 Tax=unclassified Streptomyces TaxID=2593676 RepID=UPI001368C7CE|nr:MULTISPECIES: hypothetical protein [unclassified Streptomyces]NEA03659.1 hypothetical protein [Streptomyces sp. SID10116]MYY84853.1 hypothetical protein [Streptomyces sp. SID335]MYZ15613.1 hypothetical protein [Streptomyces sp. SID337]NDZ92022.1 hypothetical protein [Streptomyces sp. SID10115]NEB50338.1 hypothetical protein [Streptomyces sp. SID339]